MSSQNRYRVRAVAPVLTLVLTTTGCVVSTTATGTAAGGTVQLIQSGELLTCSHLPYIPFQYRQADRKVVGFDVDLVDLLAKRLGITQEVIDTPWEGIQSGADLDTNLCDVTAGAMSITPARRKSFDFSTPYFHATQALLTRKGSGVSSLETARDKKVGVQTGTTGEKFVKEFNDRNGNAVTAVAFEDSALLETAVKTGQVDASINDNGILYDYAKKNPELEITAEFDTDDQYGFGVRKGNSGLLTELNAALTGAAADGSYAKLFQKWFGKNPTWLPGR
ncbi:basic amino acid ABC transporter substrate-binding protein [Kutzneria viridogrisea]